MSSSAAKRGSFAILLAAFLWSTGGLFIKSVSLDAFSVSLWRSSLAAVTIYVIYYYNRATINGSATARPSWFNFHTLLSSFFYALLLILFVVATKLTTSANAIFLQYTAPIYVLFIEPFVYKTKIRSADLGMVLISTAAMALFFVGKFDTSSIWGNVAALASGICFAVYAVLLKHERSDGGVRWRAVILGHIFIALSMLVLVALGITHPIPSANEALMLAYLGVVQIGIAYAIFTFGISHVRAIDAILLSMIEPVLNPVWVYFGIGETPTSYAIIGGIIILIVVAARTILNNRATEPLEYKSSD